ncbi:MAG: ABC transporter ATP-binding protein [Clostridia bacterium]|jgi:putative ABC transport system ATP-binding protein
MEPVIVARGLTKIYKTKAVRMMALNHVDLDVMPGEFCAITGTSGSGKSTLLSLLAGLESPTAGKVFIHQNPIHRMSKGQLVKFRLHHVGFIFQSFNLFPTLTVLENATFPLACQGVRKREREERAKDLLTMMGLGSHLNHKPVELSGGQQQRVAIARAIITKSRIVFADEPTGNLDSKTSEEIMDILRGIVIQNGTTLLMVTHDMEKARHADRVIHLSDGMITDTGPMKEYGWIRVLDGKEEIE